MAQYFDAVHLAAYGAVFAALVLAAEKIAAITSTKKDDEIVARVKAIEETLFPPKQ